MFKTTLSRAAAHAERQPLIKFLGKRTIPSMSNSAPPYLIRHLTFIPQPPSTTLPPSTQPPHPPLFPARAPHPSPHTANTHSNTAPSAATSAPTAQLARSPAVTSAPSPLLRASSSTAASFPLVSDALHTPRRRLRRLRPAALLWCAEVPMSAVVVFC